MFVFCFRVVFCGFGRSKSKSEGLNAHTNFQNKHKREGKRQGMLSLCAQRSTRTGRTVAAARHLLRSHNKLAIAQQKEQQQEEASDTGDVVVALAVAKHNGVGCVRGDELARRAVLDDVGVNSDTAVVRGRAKVCVALASIDEDGDEGTFLVLSGEGSDEGDSLAMAWRGYCHWEGDGVAQDKQQAV